MIQPREGDTGRRKILILPGRYTGPTDDSLVIEALVSNKRSRRSAGKGIAWGVHLSRLGGNGTWSLLLVGEEVSSDGLKDVIDAF